MQAQKAEAEYDPTQPMQSSPESSVVDPWQHRDLISQSQRPTDEHFQ